MKPLRFSPAALLNTLQQQAHFGRYLVAFSGGLDSHVLLYALSQLAQEQAQLIQLRALHIDHGLQSASKHWAQHCHKVCQTLEIPYKCVALDLAQRVSNNLEAQARKARYQVFAEQLKPQEYLLTAHHQDDQAETVLLHLLRGSGTQGLAAMPQQRPFAQGYLCRPLLAFSRQALADYATQQQLDYLHDPSNDDTHFDRNFLRHEIIPRLQTHWSGVKTNLARVARLQAEAYEIVAHQAQHDLQDCHLRAENSILYRGAKITSDRVNTTLSISRLKRLSFARQKNLLYDWIKQANLALPTEKKIQTILTDVLAARVDALPCVDWHNTEVRRYQDALYLLSKPTDTKKTQTPQEYIWDLRFVLDIQSERYHWRLQPEGLGEYLQGIIQAQTQQLVDSQVVVRFRQGGEVIKPKGQKQTRPLKKVLHEAQIPPWERPHIPLVYYQGHLILVWGICLGESV